MGKATGKGSTPASQNPIVHSPTRQHRDTLTGRFVHCAGDACPQCHANSGHAPVSAHPCPGGHERWITVATDSPGRLKLYRHIQTHYDCQLAMRMLTRFGLQGVAFAAMMADAFCSAGLLATVATDGVTPVPRFAYFKSPLNDYRESMQRGDRATLDFVADLLLSGQWRKEDLAGFVPSNIIQFDPHTNGRSPTSAA